MHWIHRTFLYFMVSILYIFSHIKYKVVKNGLGPPPDNTGILTTNNHQRDDDVVLLGPAFLFAWRKWEHAADFGFIGRGDLFMPRYFSIFYPGFCGPVKRLLFHFNLGPLLKFCNAHPMHKLGIRNLHELLIGIVSAVGDRSIDEVLAEGWKEKYPSLDKLYKKSKGKLCVSGCFRYPALDDLRKKASYEDLVKDLYSPVKNQCVETIKKSLSDLTSMLDNGNALYFPVEGGLTRDGSLKNFRAGFGRIVEECGNVSLIPVNISYDFMQKTRPAVFLNFGKAAQIRQSNVRSGLVQDVTDKILALQTATMTSLLSLAVTKLVRIAGKTETDLFELLSMTKQVLDVYRKHDHFTDRRLDSARFFLRRLQKAVKWGIKAGLWHYIKKVRNFSLRIDIQAFNAVRPGPFPNVNFFRYILNQLPDYILNDYLGSSDI